MSWTRLFDRPEWTEHCEKWSGFRGSPLVATLLAEMDSRHVSDLVERYQDPQLPHETNACQGFFYLLLKNQDPRFGKGDQTALANMLYEQIIDDQFHKRKDYERWPLSELWAMAAGASAVDIFVDTAAKVGFYNVDLFRGLAIGPLNRGAPGELEAYLPVLPDVLLGSGSIPPIGLSERDVGLCHVLVRHLTKLGSPRAVEAIRRLEGPGGGIGEKAIEARQILNDAPQDTVEALWRQWRAQHDGESLAALYQRYLDALPMDTSMEFWLRRLGEPSTRYGRSATYATVDGRMVLYVDMDSEGCLSGISLKEY